MNVNVTSLQPCVIAVTMSQMFSDMVTQSVSLVDTCTDHGAVKQAVTAPNAFSHGTQAPSGGMQQY